MKIAYPLLTLLLLLVASILFLPANVHAGPVNPQYDPDAAPESAPIDGGLSVLLAAGVAYGARKMHKNHQQKGTNTSPNP